MNRSLNVGDEIVVQIMHVIAEFGSPILLRVHLVNLQLIFDLPVDYGSLNYWLERRDLGIKLKLVVNDFNGPNKVNWKVSELPNYSI